NIFIKSHPNNIGTHTNAEQHERGFPGTQSLEDEVVQMTAQMLGAEGIINGYIASGGTESNIMAVILARERLRLLNDGPIAILCSIFTHYSIRKAAWATGLCGEEWHTCTTCSEKYGNGHNINHYYRSYGDKALLKLIGTDQAGRILLEPLQNRIAELYSQGIKNFIVVSNEGNIITGGIDNTELIGAMIDNYKQTHQDANFHLHVDAAFGGLVVPFVYPERNLSFRVPVVDSICVDFHKMGKTPYPSAVFMYRDTEDNFYRSLLGVAMGYVPGETDGTLSGSRPGTAAAACYSVIMHHGLLGFKSITHRCMEVVGDLRTLMLQEQGIEVLASDINIVAFRLKYDVELPKRFVDGICLVYHRFPSNLSDVDDHVKMIYKVTVMPHFTLQKAVTFVIKLREQLVLARELAQ
ncbi:MAG: pyridoxal-dependent decarboxylase, partial [Candidatus Komeilibacteria bacterium]|nr:pyridoxal-dependent decarboxylase [Candidatus Komeilibacteria bacterium]